MEIPTTIHTIPRTKFSRIRDDATSPLVYPIILSVANSLLLSTTLMLAVLKIVAKPRDAPKSKEKVIKARKIPLAP